MKKLLSVLLSVCMLLLMAGCSEKEQAATYVLTHEEESLFSMTDTQVLHARGDMVYEILETTSITFRDMDAEMLDTMVSYYDETADTMKVNAPEGVEITSAYDSSNGIYTLTMNLYLEQADLMQLAEGGYLMGLGDNPEEYTFISFKKTCEGLEASGYTKAE